MLGISTVVFMALACAVAMSPVLEGGVFKFIQEFQGYISPGIVAAFVFGFAVKKAPPAAGVAALLASAPVYGLLQWGFAQVPYLHRMVWTLAVLVALMAAITAIRPLKEPARVAGATRHGSAHARVGLLRRRGGDRGGRGLLRGVSLIVGQACRSWGGVRHCAS